MRVSREVPPDLVNQLQRARDLERIADTHDQLRRAVAGTGNLLLAAVDRGWLVVDLASVIGISAGATSKRVRDARRRRGNVPLGLVVDSPPNIRGPLAEVSAAVDHRAWLTRAEAADYLCVAPRTVQDLFKAGLLPNSRTVSSTWRVYLRADLERVRRGPRRGVYLDRVALMAIIRAESPPGCRARDQSV